MSKSPDISPQKDGTLEVIGCISVVPLTLLNACLISESIIEFAVTGSVDLDVGKVFIISADLVLGGPAIIGLVSLTKQALGELRDKQA